MLDVELLQNFYYAAPELWILIAAVFLSLLLSVIYLSVVNLRQKQKNYFLKRDRERYAETLYASHDGYFAFIYPDEKVNDPRKTIKERCSRRLAVILNLPTGTKSSFEDVMKNFYKDDVKKIYKYVALLKEEGVAFEDYFILKNSEKYIRLEGVRINGADGNIYCDMIWFRDVSFATNRIKSLEEEKSDIKNKLNKLVDLIDNLPLAIWLRDNNYKIVFCNRKYTEFLPNKSRDDVLNDGCEIIGTNGESIALELAKRAHKSNRKVKTPVGVIVDGSRVAMEACETPFYAEQNLDKTYSAGCLININELDQLRRNLKQHQEAQLEILGALGTAFAVFNQNMLLNFYNQPFAKLWNLDPAFLDDKPTYSAFLDVLREKRLLPEVPDFKAFRQDEVKNFSRIFEPTNDLMHLPNGKTLRRMRAPYPLGGIVFAYEDISDRLAATSAYNALISVQTEMLQNLFDAVIIFGTNGRVSFYNQAYLNLWNADKTFLDSEPTFEEVLDSQKHFFTTNANWDDIKKGISDNILNMTAKTVFLRRNDDKKLELSIANLSDGSLMIAYLAKEISDN